MENERIFYEFDKNDGTPDGMTIDSNDNLWVAMWGGSKVVNIDTKNCCIIQEIALPCSCVTSCCFGGDELQDLYITTASIGVDMANEPQAGSMWVVKNLSVHGIDPVSYRKE